MNRKCRGGGRGAKQRQGHPPMLPLLLAGSIAAAVIAPWRAVATEPTPAVADSDLERQSKVAEAYNRGVERGAAGDWDAALSPSPLVPLAGRFRRGCCAN